ncbi:MAG TPA: gliding motility-associated C-terminal domain-containing protein, partial [Chitinophagales bacterium]|nr:gliding motility-associated C-terminal domain-containing protein [Chitinophagales bacterium]
TVTADNGSCTSTSATFTIAGQLTTPATPTVSVTAPTCTDAGFAQVTNYDGTLNYTLSSNNISIDGSGKITGAAGNYTVTVGNGSCSATSASFSIASKLVVPSVPTVNVIAATCSTAGSAQVSNYNSSLVYTVSPNTANIDGSGKITGAAGPYTVTADNGSCTSTSATFTIDALISSAPTPVLSADNTTICAGNSALLSSDVTTVKWYRDAAKTNVLGTGTPISTGNLSATTTFYAENTSGACIGALASITINVVAAPSAPTATKLPNKSSVCIGTTLTIQNPQYGTNSGNSCPFEYQSSTDAGQTWSAVSSTVPSLIADGTENIIRIRVSACNGCTASNWTDYSWTVISDTARPAITGNLSVCTGTSTTLVANAPIGSTVRWYSDNGLTTLVNTGTSFSPIITSNTSFFVTQTQDLCTSAATQVDVVALPAPAAPTLTLGHSPICGGQNTDLYSSSSTVVWYLDAAKSNRIGVGSTINTGTIYTTMTYYAADTSGLLCPSPLSSITVDVIPAPDLGNIVDVSICSGTSALLTGGSSATEWYSDDAMTNNINMGATYQTPILTATTNYYLRVPSSCGVTLDTVTVTVKPIPAAPTANDVEVCSGLSASIALANVSPGATVQWYNAPSLDNMIHVGSVLITPILTSDAVYYVTQTVDGCTSPSSSFNVYVKPSSNAPTLTANPNVICFGDASALSSSSTATIWYSDAGQTVIGNGQTISVSPLLTTTYYAQDTAVGCSALASVTVKVDSILPAPNIQDVTVCQGADAVLTGGNSGTAWYAADQTTLIGTGATIIVTNVQSASLYYARNEGSSCVSAFDDVTIHITTTPPPTAADAEVCSGQSASLSATGQNIVWYSDAGLTNAVQSGSVLITPALTSDVTYYVTNESNGCESEATAVQVTVTTPAPAPVITANPTSVCSGGTTELSSSAGANTVWYSDAGMTVVGSGSPFTSAPLLATTTFYARDNSVPNCPGELASVQVLISASETAPNVSNTSVCEGSSATLTGGTANTHWYSDASLTTEVNVGTNYTTPVLSTATTYYLRNENGLCVSPVTEVTVSVNPIPAAPTADVVEPICGSGSASLSAQGDANAIITWYADGAMTNALHIGSSYITPILTANTSYYVTQELNGCESAVTEVEVEINELPTIDPVDPQQVCSGSTAIFEADNPNGYDIEWYSDPAGLDLWQIGDEFETPVLTQYTAWYYRAVDPITGCEGEIQSTWADVVSNKDITITATSKPTCVDEDIVVNVASYDFSGLVGIFDYDGNLVAVEDINGTTGGTQVILPGLPVAGVYSYYVLEAGDIFCATSSSTFTVEVVDRPVIDNVVGDEICIGEVAQITATATPANAIITWYSDATLANAVGTGNTLTIPGLTVNTTYYAVASNGLCASDPMDVEVIVNPIPATPELSSNSPVCEGSELTLSTTTAGNVTYIWSGPAGFLSGDQNPVIASVTMANQGLYSLKVQDNVSGCTSLTASVQVNINTAPTAPTASNSGATCEGGSAILSATTIPGATYEWTGPNGFSGSQQVITLNQVTLAQAGTYSVRAFVNGCWSSATTTDLVVNEKPIVSIPDVKPVCEGGNLEIIATTNSANPVYDWRGPNNYVGQNATVTIQDVKESKHQGAYTLQVTDGTTGCKSDVVATWVVINEKPNNIMAINNSPKCEGGSVQLNASNIIGATYTWTGPDGFASQDRSPIITDLNANKVGTYTLTVTLGDCLSETVTTTVEMNDKPVANAGDDITTQTNVPVKLNGSGGIIYAWSPANMLSFSNIPNPTFIAGSVGVYEMELTVTNEFGCSDADTVVVNVEKATTNLDSVVIPDLITPNGDGINDVWRLDFLKDINMSYEIAVYARGGSKIMISTNYNNDWTGTYKGKELPDGVYWYAIVLENGAVYKGSLTIKR